MNLKIKQYLEEHGIKQTFIQKKLGISLSSCNAMLNGNRGMSAEEYFKICDALNVPLEYFKEGTAIPAQYSTNSGVRG